MLLQLSRGVAVLLRGLQGRVSLTASAVRPSLGGGASRAWFGGPYRSGERVGKRDRAAARMEESDARDFSRRVVERLKETGINFLALDFDLTVLDIHTGGRWTGTADELGEHIRPFFQYLIPDAVAADIFVAIVTFSPQTPMIKEVLKQRFPDIFDRIPIRGEDNTWVAAFGGPEKRASLKGKQAHMASAAAELQQRWTVEVSKASTVLIDDDRNNIRVALEEGVRAHWIDPNRPDELPEKILSGEEEFRRSSRLAK